MISIKTDAAQSAPFDVALENVDIKSKSFAFEFRIIQHDGVEGLFSLGQYAKNSRAVAKN
jgi:hypothetical protein